MITHLIAKDLRAYYRPIIGSLLFGAVFVNLSARLSPMDLGPYVMSMAVFIATGMMTFLSQEKKTSIQLLLGSLPVTRRTTVVARYLSAMINAVIGGIVWYGFTWLSIETNSGIPFAMSEFLSPKIVAVVAFVVVVQFSILLPAFFRFGTTGTILAFFGSMILPLFFTIKVLRTKSDEFVPHFVAADLPLYGSLAVVIVVLLTISVLISLMVHQNRDL